MFSDMDTCMPSHDTYLLEYTNPWVTVNAIIIPDMVLHNDSVTEPFLVCIVITYSVIKLRPSVERL